MGSLDELYTSPQVAKRLGVTRQRIDQLVESGDLPQPVGRSGRNRLWSASQIELAVAGRDPSSGRLRMPDWDTVPEPGSALRLDVDEVLPVPGVWGGDDPQVHVRIWRGPVAGAMRTVVLYGALVEAHGIIVNHAETVARAIAAAHLGVGEARSAWWFSFWPRGFPHPELGLNYVSFSFPRAGGSGGALVDALLRRGSQDAWTGEFEEPIWKTVTPAQLARVLGSKADLDYPPGTYTAAVVAQLAGGRRPAVVDFDPRGLRAQLRRVRCLHAYRQALMSGDQTRTGLPALGLLTRSGHDQAARTGEALGIAVRVLLPAAELAAGEYEAQEEEPDIGDDLVERRFPPVESADRDLLSRYANLTHTDLSSGAVQRALTAVRALIGALADQEQTGAAHADADLADALESAVPELVSVRHLLDPSLIDDPGPSLRSLSRLGDAERAYLASVSWWGPAEGDAHRAAALRGHMWEKDLVGARTGYDPFGRMVLHNPTTEALAVERPRALPATPYPDHARVLATPEMMTAFVELPDGRCDILPTDPRSFYDDVTWGYGGTGPEVLARALSFAVLPHPDPEHPLELEQRPQAVQDDLFELTARAFKDGPIAWTVQELRAAGTHH